MEALSGAPRWLLRRVEPCLGDFYQDCRQNNYPFQQFKGIYGLPIGGSCLDSRIDSVDLPGQACQALLEGRVLGVFDVP